MLTQTAREILNEPQDVLYRFWFSVDSLYIPGCPNLNRL